MAKHKSLQQRLAAAGKTIPQMGGACKKVKVKDSVLGELLQLEELPGPLLLDNMQDEVHSTTHTYTFTIIYYDIL